ncbi:hypothetical protein COCSUDRAFT_63442 [Coccomyxa subellipsoidea C-169]|uniref:Uncharacterized protein n=1 Tax=Coccomyxa subellipsoidea (strain C-169) TaxID=574566 RepID=I0YXE1_COCSC|nr:hypothetical protein COCSUDRAFT_63442 [Coccomyxa subellipsoidea C-169]EIE23060.1 hypothetical protein COCSUDRAFT_63442 [Coccomyxa subellipsoidea C-169]|eukprot:XP_005647604.1 hypothetical protein COCSUDRAFT_63442 [Coccomyxa subellipsoidea C-169]
MGARVTFGRPTVDDIISALQVAMAFPLVGKGKRPYEVLVAWRLRDMWPKLEKWLREMEILPCLERREEAAVTSAAHGLHIEGRNNPGKRPYEVLVTRRLRNMWPQLKKFLHEIEIVATLETRKAAMLPSVDHALVMEAQSSPEPKLPKPPIPIEQLKLEGNQFYALQQYVEAADSNRAIAYLQLGLHAKALADAEEAIRLNPKYIKGYARKGLALEKLGRVADARAHYRGCIFTLKRNECFKTALQRMETNNL